MSSETRPITTSAYLTESVDRHRNLEASRLRDYLRTREGEASKPWNKPSWPGPKVDSRNDESLRELEEIKKKIEALQKAAAEGPRKTDDLDQLARLNEKLLERAKGRQKDYKIVESEIIRTAPEPVPLSVKDVSSATWQFSTQSFSPRSVVSVNGGSTKQGDGLLKVRTDLSPEFMRSHSRSNAAVQTAHLEEKMTSKAAAYQSEREPWPYMPAHLGSVADSAQSTINREYSESYYRHMNRFNSLPVLDAGDSRGTLIKIKDEKPKGIMKRRELDTKEQMMYPEDNKYNARDFGGDERWEEKRRVVQSKPQVTETVQKIEEHKRTEEIERRVQRKERKEKRHRSSHRNHHGGYTHEALGWSDGGYRTGSASQRNGYLPSNESYYRTSTTRREKDARYIDDDRYLRNGGYPNGRYGSVTDSLRRGELKYVPNGDLRESYSSSRYGGDGRVHKSYSTRDVYDGGYYDERRSSSSHRSARGSQQGAPLVEFPPTLPRVALDREAPIPPPHRARSTDYYKPISRSRSYADWEEGRSGNQQISRRRDDDMMRLENEFRDSLLMPLPNGPSNLVERDHRTEQIPGGYETYDREVRATSGRRLNKDGLPTQFSEASQEYSYKRETDSNRRR